MRRRPLYASLLAGAALAAVYLTIAPAFAQASPLRFGRPVFVGRALGGGEPTVAYAVKSGLLIYTSHEGTTHLFTSGLADAPAESGSFITGYHNQVNIWTSSDNGLKWKLVPFGKSTNPFATGFSDPDLTQDDNGNIYNTGIDLANDALFSSQNGGKTWPTGTTQCHEGDRPWLAGGKANEVFLSTDADGPGHIIVHSKDAGASCQSTEIADNGTAPKGTMFAGDSYQGEGKIFYDHSRGSLLEPLYYSHNGIVGVGIGILRHASTAFNSSSSKFTDVPIAKTTAFSHWPSMGVDSKGNYYMVWDTDDRNKNSRNGCSATFSGSESFGTFPPVNAYTPLPNRVMMSVSTDGGLKWSHPRTVAYAPGHRLLWPWVVAGKAGRVGVVWYQLSKAADPDCAPANVKTTVMAAEITGATSRHWHKTTVNASGRPIHTGSICAGGTTCAADNVLTKEDRRLGDYFTVGTSKRGCIIIATGDTTLTDPLTHMVSPISHPLFLYQNSGTSLTGQPCGKVSRHHTGSGHHTGTGTGSHKGGGSHRGSHSGSRSHHHHSRRPKRGKHRRGFTG
jgi:hypothetical protein